MSEKKQFYKMQEFADVVGVSYHTVRSWIYSGQIRYKRFAPRTVRIPASELEMST